MPREALKHSEVGCWLASAGPAPQYEQLEVQRAHNVPDDVIRNIRETGDPLLIASWIYAFIDFWVFILRHYWIIIACIFFYGYLCMLQPTILIVESGKMANLIFTLPPRLVFVPGFDFAIWSRFLLGRFTMACITALGIKGCEMIWDELPLAIVRRIG